MTQPWLKFYPTDWRADPRLRMCSLAARGLWIDLITYMHEAEPYGHLTINSVAPSIEDISSLVGRPLAEVRRAMGELEKRQVLSRDAGGTIYSRRMVRDKAKAERDKSNGKTGGNPKIMVSVNEGVNPPVNGGDKAQIPEARDQNSSLRSEARKRATRIPDDWKLTTEGFEFAHSRSVPHARIATEAEKFKTYWTGASKNATSPNWPAKWRTWILNMLEREGKPNGTGIGAPRTPGPAGPAKTGADAILAGMGNIAARVAARGAAARSDGSLPFGDDASRIIDAEPGPACGNGETHRGSGADAVTNASGERGLRGGDAGAGHEFDAGVTRPAH